LKKRTRRGEKEREEAYDRGYRNFLMKIPKKGEPLYKKRESKRGGENYFSR